MCAKEIVEVCAKERELCAKERELSLQKRAQLCAKEREIGVQKIEREPPVSHSQPQICAKKKEIFVQKRDMCKAVREICALQEAIWMCKRERD